MIRLRPALAACAVLAAAWSSTPAVAADRQARDTVRARGPDATNAALGRQRDTPDASPPLGVRAAALIEESTGQQLYGENADAELPIASTTKLMTALVTLHHAQLKDVFTDPDYYPAAEDSQIHLVPGERMSVHDLLIAMMLPSADDAAVDLAYNVGHGSLSRFIAMMNARARALNLTRTHYTTPSGLDTVGNYSSAHDLTVLARYLLRSEPFIRVVVAKRGAVLRTGNHVRVVTNLNDLVGRYDWINGVKTGHTLGAGYVLVASGTRNGMTLIDAVLGTPSEAARDDAALSLLDWGFAHYGLRTPVRAGQTIARATVNGSATQTVRLVAESTDTHVFAKADRVSLRVHAPAKLVGPLQADTVVGWVTVRDGAKIQARIPLRLAVAVPKVRHSHALASVVVLSATLSGLVLAAGAVIGLTMFWREWSRG
jgi:serine-type D-Ala-D-Ala carboxypeptidase (penicillin-binding protein 5/6)